MPPVIYDVAVSIDGFISGPDADISGFAQSGPVVDAYMARLQTYACAIMGRATYEFGYRFGMEPGQNPYPHMRSYVISNSIDLPAESDVTRVADDPANLIAALRQDADGPIYLCGGGLLAGSLLRMGMIDILRLKRAPCLLGGGTPLFGDGGTQAQPHLISTESYPDGYVFQEYRL